MAATSDFVKKLYKMLEDQSVQHVVSWGPQGDCFVVKDMNEFTKSILPRMFKHSNFASFVRQLNKYDFHKVKNTDDNQYGEHSWTFRHPDFHADRRDALENIKRKVPAQRKSTHNNRSLSTTPPGTSTSVDGLQHQVDRLTQSQDDMSAHLRNLERSYQDVLVEMVNFQRNMAQQDNLMQNLIQYFLNSENAKTRRNGLLNDLSSSMNPNPFDIPSPMSAHRLLQQQDQQQQQQQQQRQPSPLLPANNDGMNFGNDATNGSAEDFDGSKQEGGPSRLWRHAANLGLLNPQEIAARGSELEKAVNRQEALAKLDALQKQRANNSQILSNIYGMVGKGMQGLQQASSLSLGGGGSADVDMDSKDLGEGSSSWRDGGADSASANTLMPSAAALSPGWMATDLAQNDHLEVYTLGHLVPRAGYDDNSVGTGLGLGAWALQDGAGPSNLEQLVSMGSNGGEGSTSNAFRRLSPDFSGMQDPGEASGSANASSSAGGSSSSPKQKSPGARGGGSKIRVRRTTIVPDWAVPPRVLLVDDDAVSRKLSSKFLQVFGCTIDVAVDGVGAVNKMNLEKYDLVLMDIVMPKLDGISATSIIRKFDHLTPIISMTGNSKPNEIMTYFSSGMNDILAKPFTKQSLLDVLEKHLTHLKVIQQMAQIPRSVGLPPLSDSAFEQVLAAHAAALTNSLPLSPSNNASSSSPSGPLSLSGLSPGPSGESQSHFMGLGLGLDDSRANPLASMGLSDDMYQAMIHNLINTGQFMDAGMGSPNMGSHSNLDAGNGNLKRPLDDGADSNPSGKRSRFEVLE